MTNILMVCLGNICRSPLAEGILKSKLSNDSFFIDSAGTGNYHIGENPDPRSVAVAKQHGIDIASLKARQFDVSDFKKFDLIYVMDASNYTDVLALAKNENDKAKVKFILNETNPHQNNNVPDPYYGGNDGFEKVYAMLDEACNHLVKKLFNMATTLGSLYLIPTTLGDNDPLEVLPITVKNVVEDIDTFIVENDKTARRFIKRLSPKKSQPALTLFHLNKFTDVLDLPSFLEPCLKGFHVGLLSEAGCPGVADPGAEIVKIAHQKNIKVIPLVGPSSILMALMSSGLNGQNFAFNGYLPIDKTERKNEIKRLEHLSFEQNQSQIFIETPYRNNKMLEDLSHFLDQNTAICVASDITLPTEFIKTQTAQLWKKNIVDLHKRPTIFIIHKS